MLNHKFSGIFYPFIQSGHAGFDKSSPVVGSHDHPLLLSPVISKVNGIQIILKCHVQQTHHIVTDFIIQNFQFLRVQNHGSQRILHSHQTPGTFEHQESKSEKGKSVSFCLYQCFNIPAQPGNIRFRELIIILFQIFNQRLIHHADILICSCPVPDNPEFISEMFRFSFYFRGPSPILCIMQITAQLLFYFRISCIFHHSFQCLLRKFQMIRNR